MNQVKGVRAKWSKKADSRVSTVFTQAKQLPPKVTHFTLSLTLLFLPQTLIEHLQWAKKILVYFKPGYSIPNESLAPA